MKRRQQNGKRETGQIENNKKIVGDLAAAAVGLNSKISVINFCKQTTYFRFDENKKCTFNLWVTP